MEPLDASAFVLEELSSADGGPPLRVALRGRDAPLGGRGSGGAFELAPQVRQSEFYYPGSNVPTRQVMGVKYAPLVIKGNLQDRGTVGRARAIAEDLERLALRGRALRISWGPWAFFGLMDSPKLSPEGLRDINYEVSLHIDGRDLPSTALAVALPEESSPTELLNEAAAARALAGDELAKALPDAAAGEAFADPRDRFLDAADALVLATADLDGARALTPAEIGRVESTGLVAATTGAAFALVVGDVAPPGALGWQRAVAWQRAQTAAAEAAWSTAEVAMQTRERLEQLARGEAEASHDARGGQTLESIARERLGDEGRAAEIARRNNLPGYRVVGGQRLTLPAR